MQGAQSEEQLVRHSDELFRRLRWCVDAGSDFWPANKHVHMAPGVDENFVFGVPPWFADGSPNTAAIPDAQLSVIGLLPAGGCMVHDEVYGWECRRCGQQVDSACRAFSGPDEPAWWWWCPKCRAATGSEKTKSKKQQHAEKLAARCQKIQFVPSLVETGME